MPWRDILILEIFQASKFTQAAAQIGKRSTKQSQVWCQAPLSFLQCHVSCQSALEQHIPAHTAATLERSISLSLQAETQTWTLLLGLPENLLCLVYWLLVLSSSQLFFYLTQIRCALKSYKFESWETQMGIRGGNQMLDFPEDDMNQRCCRHVFN